jgi:signal transduction histidine kinase
MRSHASQTALLLTELLAELSECRDVDCALQVALDWATETLDAEYAVAVRGEQVIACRGFGVRTTADDVVKYVVGDSPGRIAAPDGPAFRASAPVAAEEVDRLVVMRLNHPLDRHERGLILGMARTLEQTLRLLGALALERAAREELDQANSQLVEANQLKQEFISMASHELRTPLTSVLGFTETLKFRDPDLSPDERAVFLDAIIRQGRRLRSLVDDLLDLSRYESASEVRPETLVLERLIRTVVQESFSDAEIHLEVDPKAVVTADPEHVTRILANLLDNARKYGSPPIRVMAEIRDGWVVLTVHDSGDGVPESFVPHLFERFTQASTGERREAHGTGLGLAIVKTLVEQNHGEVRYVPTEHGARFEVRLPMAAVGDPQPSSLASADR